MNLRGWRTSKKIIVIESDDWGATRMPSPAAYRQLLDKNIRVDDFVYNRLDCLESKEDLENLFEVLNNNTYSNFRPKFTFNTVMGNPDFDKIQESGFNEYVHEHFFESYKKYYGEDNKPLWLQAIREGLVKPQFHAREHLNTPLWMRDLKAGHKDTITAFNEKFYALQTQTSCKFQNDYLAGHAAYNLKDLKEIEEGIIEGLGMFKTTFGFPSKTFIGCKYIWPNEIEKVLNDEGVMLLQGQRGRQVPLPAVGSKKTEYYYTGKKNQYGQIYTVRNVLFEPFENDSTDWVKKTIEDISLSFFCGKPAIISSHRINYAGGMSIAHRDKNLKLLDTLLKKIRKKWPDVEFFTSDQLAEIMKN